MNKRESYNNSLIDKLIWITTVFFIVSINLFDASGNIKIVLVTTMSVALILILIKAKWTIRFSLTVYHLLILIFILYGYSTLLWAIRPSDTIMRMTTVLETFICMSVFYMYYSKENSISIMLDCMLWGGYIVTLYSFLTYKPSTMIAYAISGIRMDQTFANLNSIGLSAALSAFISIYKTMFEKFRIYYLFSIVSIFLVAITQSRKAVILLGFGAFFTIIYRSINDKDFKKTIINLLVVVIFMVVAVRLLLSLRIFSGVNQRIEGMVTIVTGNGVVERSAKLRNDFIIAGLRQFMKTPLFGVGIGNAHIVNSYENGIDVYLHNNYVEMLVNGGIVGTLLYYAIFVYPLSQLIKYRKYHVDYTGFCIIFNVALLIMDFAMVSYFSIINYFYLLIIYLQLFNVKKSKKDIDWLE